MMDVSKRVIAGAWLTVNRKCNFRCPWCYAEGTEYKQEDEMSFSLAKDLTNILKTAGVKQITIIGGEPTLWNPIFEYNQFCRDQGIRTTMPTNGLRFADDDFFEKYKKSPNDLVGISLKAGNQKQLKDSIGCDKFDDLKKGIVRVCSNFDSAISLTYNTLYENNLPEIVQFAIDCGAKGIKIDFCSTVFENGKAKSNYMVPPKKLISNILRDYEKIYKITNHIIFEMSIPFCLWPRDFIKDLIEKGQIVSICQIIKRNAVIFNTDGKLQMCNSLFDYPIGKYKEDFYDAETLLNFLNCPQNIKYYDALSCYPSLKCRDCEWYSACGGGCPLRWAVYKPNEILK